MHAYRIHPVEWLQEGFTAGFHVPLSSLFATKNVAAEFLNKKSGILFAQFPNEVDIFGNCRTQVD